MNLHTRIGGLSESISSRHCLSTSSPKQSWSIELASNPPVVGGGGGGD
jgi:hypothetical protein